MRHSSPKTADCVDSDTGSNVRPKHEQRIRPSSGNYNTRIGRCLCVRTARFFRRGGRAVIREYSAHAKVLVFWKIVCFTICLLLEYVVNTGRSAVW
jgi:hypothetical protein